MLNLFSALLCTVAAAGTPDLADLQAATATAQPQQTEPSVLLVGGTTTVVSGAVAPLQLTVVVPPGFKVYRDMLRVDVADPGGLNLSEPSLPPGLTAPDPANPALTRELYEFDIIIDVGLSQPAAVGEHVATFDLRYQACHGGICLMPRTEQVSARLVVTDS